MLLFFYESITIGKLNTSNLLYNLVESYSSFEVMFSAVKSSFAF